jgi:hypothetical protein
MIEYVAYKGWTHNARLYNQEIELITTLNVGPRVIRFGFIGSPNVFKEFPDQLGGTNEQAWMSRGGHRLWHAPESKPRTYPFDNTPVACEEVDEYTIRLTADTEVENGIQKQIELSLSPTSNVVTVIHRITNTGRWAIELAPWALSVMDAGGMAVIPLPEKRPHTEVLVPDFPLVLWPYADMSDSRYHWGRKYITYMQDPQKGPSKIGLASPVGWAAYVVHDTLFVKYFDYYPDEVYPDFGCNFESYSNEEMLEVETLGPLTVLEPSDTLDHVETWRIFPNIPMVKDETDIERVIRPLVES